MQQEEIKRFNKYFTERLNFVESNCMGRIESVILLCCYIDSFGGYRYPDLANKVGQRFREIIIEYSSTREIWRKISIPKLEQYLRENDSIAHDYYMPLFRKLGFSRSRFLERAYNCDVNLSTMQKVALEISIFPPTEKTINLFRKFEYIEIFYNQYRNLSVHATCLDPKRAIDMWPNNEEPFYIHIHPEFDIDPKREPEVWFSFPDKFILKLTRECLDGLVQYLSMNDIDIEEIVNKRIL